MTLINYSQLSHLWKVLVGSGLVMHASSGVPAVLQVTNPANIKTVEIRSNGYYSGSGDILSKSGSTAFHWDSVNNRLGVGKRDPKSTLDVLGTMSGRRLILSNLRSCTLKSSSTGDVLCGTDLIGFTGVNSGGVIQLADGKYLKLSGGTLTGVTTVNVSGGSQNTVGLRIINTASGAHIHAEKTLSTSGTLVFEGAASGASLYIASSLQGVGLTDCDAATQTLAWDASTGRFSCGTDSDTTYTAAQGLTLAGTAFKVNSALTGSSLRFTTVSGSSVHADSMLSSSGSLSIEGTASGAAIRGFGLLTDCDSASSKVLWDSSLGRLSCGTDVDTDTNTTYTAGKGLTLNGTAFVLNDAITGSSLKISGTLSGKSLVLSNLRNCDTIDTTSTGAFVCGTDSSGGGGGSNWSNTGSILAAADTKYLNVGGDTSTGTLIINVTGGSTQTLGLKLLNTMSGAILHAERTLSASGTALFESGAYFDTSTLVVAAGPHRVGIGTTTPRTALEVVGTVSGSGLNVGGGPKVQKILYGTNTLDFPSMTSNTCSKLQVTVNGAAVGNPVFVASPPGSLTSDIVSIDAYVASTDTINVQACSHGATANPASGTFGIVVFQM